LRRSPRMKYLVAKNVGAYWCVVFKWRATLN